MKKRRLAALGYNFDDTLAGTGLAIGADFMDYFYVRFNNHTHQVFLADFHPPADARPESPASIASFDLYHINLLPEQRRVMPIIDRRQLHSLPPGALSLHSALE